MLIATCKILLYLQLVDTLREKVSTGSFFALRHGFRAFDPQGNGTVTKEALYRILFNFLGYLSHQKFVVLLQRYVRVDDGSSNIYSYR